MTDKQDQANTVTISFDAQCNVEQILRIEDNSYDEDRLLEELESGELIGTLTMGGDNAIRKLGTGELVATVIHQDSYNELDFGSD